MNKRTHRGTFERGTVRTTDNQFKKHHAQMNNRELNWVINVCKTTLIFIKNTQLTQSLGSFL